MAFNLDNYEPVADRLARALADHPEMRVITDLVAVERTPEGKPLQYIVRAQIWLGDILKAQDYAEEMVGSSPVNRTSALENCTTSAIGRALADMGYQGNLNGKASRPSREEMEKVARAENNMVTEKIEKIVYSDEQLNLAKEALDQIPAIESVNELKSFYTGALLAGILHIPVNGLTVQKSIGARKKVLEATK
jgi:hypothetical protein